MFSSFIFLDMQGNNISWIQISSPNRFLDESVFHGPWVANTQNNRIWGTRSQREYHEHALNRDEVTIGVLQTSMVDQNHSFQITEQSG